MTSSSSKLAAVDGGHLDIGVSMWSIFRHGIDSDKGHYAIIVPHQEPNYLESLVGPSHHQLGCLAWTYEQLRLGSSRLAATLQAHNVVPGSTIATFIANSADWALLSWTAAIGRYTISYLDPRAVEPARAEEVRYFLKTLKPSLIVVEDDDGAQAIQAVSQDILSSVKLGVCLRPRRGTLPSWNTLQDLGLGHQGEMVPSLSDDLNRTATVMFTSGTSVGHPKGVPRTVRNWLTCAATGCMLPIYNETVASLTSLCFRIAANTTAVGTWYNGATLIIPSPMSDWDRLVDAIERFGVTLLQPVHYQLYPIIECSLFSSRDVRSVKKVYVGGDFFNVQQQEEWRSKFPEALVANNYEMTEGTGCVGWLHNQVPDPIPVYQGALSPGRVAPGTKMRIVQDDGQISQRGQLGELHIGGSVMTPGYLDGVQPENFYTDEEGRWIKTGDTAMIDSDDNLFVLGRSKDIIKKKGVPILPSSIESCLSRYTGVTAVAIGIPSVREGEEPYAVLDHMPDGQSFEQMNETVVKMFGAEYSLSGLVTLKDLGMNEWPKNSAEKVLRRDLREATIKFFGIQ